VSTYWEANGSRRNVDFQQVCQDITQLKIKGLRIYKNAENRKEPVCITDGRDCVWLQPPCVFRIGIGLERFGLNNDDHIISILEEHYKIRFKHEQDL
jgi:hypothetical protein